MKKETAAEQAIQRIAANEGVTVDEVKRQITLAMLAGLRNPDPSIQARWRKIPCKGKIPTPEELIAYLSAHIDAGIDPFA